MSTKESHIPQPESVAPTQQFTSVETAPHGPSVSLEVPGIPPTEAVTHLGELNNIDNFFYEQDIHAATFNWTTRDEPGKLLWYIPISPQAMNKALSYISKLYIGWAGDFLITFKIAGTAFHAGNMVVVAFPPSEHPTKYAGSKNYTMFPWCAADPKTLEIMTITARDKRPMAYHYTDGFDFAGGESNLNIGGYIAAFVDLQLNTSSSGSQAIQVQVWSKCAPNFKFVFFRPPTIEILPGQVEVPPMLEYYLNFSLQSTNQNFIMSSNAIVARKLVAFSSDTKELTSGFYNTYNVEGEYTKEVVFKTDFYLPDEPNIYTVKSNSTSAGVKTIRTAPFWEYHPNKETSWALAPTDTYVALCLQFKEESDIQNNEYLWDHHGEIGNFPLDKPAIMPHPTDYKRARLQQTQFKHLPITASTPNESFLLFMDEFNDIWSIQHFGMTRYFKTGALKNWIPPGQCALFLLNDAEENLPIAYVKLYQKGFMTIDGTKDQIIYDLFRMSLKFYGFLAQTDAMPLRTPAMAQNRLMVNLKHRSLNKSSRKLAAKKH